MKFNRNILTDLERCYSVACMDIDNKPFAFFASEGRFACYAYNCADYSEGLTVWEQPGGTMSIVKVPGRKGEFLAGQKFFKMFDWEEAEMVWVRTLEDGSFSVKTMLKMPYLHRFDILQRNGKNYFIGCTLASAKNAKDDWSNPGSVYVGELPDDENGELVLTELRSDFFKNHGYERVTWDGLECGMVSCDSGVYIVTPPSTADDTWSIEQIMTQPVSDIACIDIDGDGDPEIAAIEDFHGSYFRVYKMIDGEYRQIFEHPEVTEFYHVAASGNINGKPVFLGGCRRGKQQLFILNWNNESSEIEINTVDENVGPSNAMIVNLPDRDIIISANREIGQAAIYDIEP